MEKNKKVPELGVTIPIVLSELWDEFIRECNRRNLTTSEAFEEAITVWIANKKDSCTWHYFFNKGRH